MTAELPKLSLRDAADDNSLSSVSSPAPGPLSPPLGSIDNIGDLQEVPINDTSDIVPVNSQQPEMFEEVIHLVRCHYCLPLFKM